jgi:molecular chaperone GrpE (heat shock protein)
MSEVSVPTVPKWPFLLGDVLLLGVAGGLAWQTHTGAVPYTPFTVTGIVGSVAVGAWLLCRPFLREHEAAVQAGERTDLSGTLAQIRQLEGVGQMVTAAAAQIQASGLSLAQVEKTAQSLTGRIAEERTQFTQFLQNFNDQEKQTLRLETEKLRRGEKDVLLVLVHVLDHTYALFQAGARSGQPGLTQQLAQFRGACLEAVRRIGLVAQETAPGTAFDPEQHQTPDGQEAAPGSPIAGTFACGYTFQGALLRRVIVVTQEAADRAAIDQALGADPDAAGGPGGGVASTSPASLF